MSCGCQQCGGSGVAAHCDPYGMAMGERMGALETIGDVLPTIVWPSDVRAKKKELQAFMLTLDSAFNAGCSKLSAEDAVAYDTFSAAWKDFYAADDSALLGLGASNRWDEAIRFQEQISLWQDKFAAECGLVVPKVKPPSESGTSQENLLGTIKTVAIVAGVIAGVVVVAPIVWEAVATAKAVRTTRGIGRRRARA